MVNVPMVVFFGIFSTVFLGMNYLFLWRVFVYLNFTHPFLWSVSLVVFFLSAMFLQEKLNNAFSFFLHKIASIWFGVVWIGLFVVLLVEILRLIHPNFPWESIALFALTILVIVSVYNAHTWITFEHEIVSSKVQEPVRIVHLTDQHLHGVGAQKKLGKVVALVKPLNPDVVVITGDLVDAPGRPDAKIFNSFKQLGVPVIFTLGNHEFYVGADWTQKAMEDAGSIVLRTGTKNVKNIQFFGIDDSAGGLNLQTELGKLEGKNKFKVLLYHQPDPVQPALDKGIDLMLSGHTHAGQIYPFNLFVMLRYKYWKGLYDVEGMQLYVNPGTGTWMIPMRLGSRNTIGVFDVIPN